MNYVQQLKAGGYLFGLSVGTYVFFKSCIYFGKLEFSLTVLVEPGHKAFKFSKISGVQPTIYSEGYNFNMPYFERPIIYDVRTQPRVM